MTQSQCDKLRDIHARLQGAPNEGVDRFYDVNQGFHELIYEASCSAFLAEQTRKLRNRVAAYRRRVTRMPNRVADTIREHEAVMDAIFAHDVERAHAAMRAHLTLLGDNLLDFVATFDEACSGYKLLDPVCIGGFAVASTSEG
jgi:DNA-binding GntR family transcriptional regulator